MSLDTPPPPTLEGLLAAMRLEGWMVAVHNDYRLGGVPHTFWGFTHTSGRFVKGEGRTDVVAVKQAMEAAHDLAVVGDVPAIESTCVWLQWRGRNFAAQLPFEDVEVGEFEMHVLDLIDGRVPGLVLVGRRLGCPIVRLDPEMSVRTSLTTVPGLVGFTLVPHAEVP